MSTQTKSITFDESMVALRDYSDHRSAFLSLLADHGSAVHPAQTQVEYKTQWYPDTVLPEHIGFHGCMSLKAVWNISRVTKSI